MSQHVGKSEAIGKLEKLLDVAGVVTLWSVIVVDLERCTHRTLNALVYRIECARAEAFEEGVARGRGEANDESDPGERYRADE